MNCADYEQAISAQPDGEFAGGPEHVAGCDACRALRDEARAFDERIRAALAVPVPELSLPELPEASVTTLEPRRRLTTPAWFGLAAAAAMVAYIGLLFVQPDTSGLTLAEQVVAHMDHEPESRVVTTVAVPERTLDAVVSNEVAELEPGIGLISYARSCPINGKLIPHLVIQGEHGPVTVLLLPDEPLDGPVPIEGEAIHGVILPLGDGSIAIIGEREHELERIEQRVLDSVRWRT